MKGAHEYNLLLTCAVSCTRQSGYLGAVKHHGALRVSGGGRGAGRLHLRSDEHGLLQPPEVVLAEDEVGQVARETSGLKDFHLTEKRRGNKENKEEEEACVLEFVLSL